MIAGTKSSHPASILVCLVVFQMLLLTIVPTVLSTAPPLDVVEGWTWAPHWLIGTYKHPPGPAWSIEVMHFIVPGYFLGPYLLAQISVGLTYVCVYLTGRVLMDNRQAMAAALLSSGSLYFTFLTTQFNHNVLQLPFWSAIILTFAYILRSPDRTLTWLVLGALVGSGMYAKYSVCVIALVIALAGLVLPRVRAELASPRPYLAIALAVLIFTPHVIWLVENDFLPFKYVGERTQNHGSVFEPFMFVFAQVAVHLPILALLGGVGLSSFRALKKCGVTSDIKVFFRIMVFGPLALVVFGALLSGKELLDMWGMPMFTTVGLWLVAEIDREWNPRMLSRLGRGATIVVAISGLAFLGEAYWSRSHTPHREFWPMAELADKASGIWASETSFPLEITGGTMWLAGLVSLGLPKQSDVVVGTDLQNSPWITLDDIRQKGMLYMTDKEETKLPAFCSMHGPVHKIELSNPTLSPLYATVCLPVQHGSTPSRALSQSESFGSAK